MGIGLIVSVVIGKPFLQLLAKKQNLLTNVHPSIRPYMEASFKGMTFRIGIFFLLHTGLATWAALEWSTRAWALLKGVGFTASFVLYMLVETLWMRRQTRKRFFQPKSYKVR